MCLIPRRFREKLKDSRGSIYALIVFIALVVTASSSELADVSMKTSTSATLPHKPEDWPRVFEQHLNAADLDAVMKLYEPGAHFVTKSGEILVSRDAIRKVLSGMIDAKTQMHSRVVRAVTVDDVAQLLHGL